jgi:cyanate lyase
LDSLVATHKQGPLLSVPIFSPFFNAIWYIRGAKTLEISMMKRTTCTELLIHTINEKEISYQQLADKIGRSLVWTTLALHGQATMEKSEAEKVVGMLGLNDEVSRALQEMPLRGSLDQNPPADPTIYRFYELVQVYGTTLKAIINEKFGDGIMSAIDFTMEIEKLETPNGEKRVKITMDGKFLPFKKW